MSRVVSGEGLRVLETKEEPMTRKIIQITTATENDDVYLYALMSDGTLWLGYLKGMQMHWLQVATPPAGEPDEK